MGNCFVLAAEEIVAVMDGQCGVQRGDPAAEERRRAALVPFHRRRHAVDTALTALPAAALAGAPRDRDAPGATWPCTYGWRGPTAGEQGERCRLSGWEHGTDLRSREGPKCHLARSDGL